MSAPLLQVIPGEVVAGSYTETATIYFLSHSVAATMAPSSGDFTIPATLSPGVYLLQLGPTDDPAREVVPLLVWQYATEKMQLIPAADYVSLFMASQRLSEEDSETIEVQVRKKLWSVCRKYASLPVEAFGDALEQAQIAAARVVYTQLKGETVLDADFRVSQHYLALLFTR